MNQQQRRYALDRVNEIAHSKKATAKKKYTKPGKSVTATERAELIRSGKVKLKANVRRIGHYDEVVNVFDFSKFVSEETCDKEAFAKAETRIDAEAASASDEIMLGDEAVALQLIQKFNNLKI